jgi:hypothetical protein
MIRKALEVPYPITSGKNKMIRIAIRKNRLYRKASPRKKVNRGKRSAKMVEFLFFTVKIENYQV